MKKQLEKTCLKDIPAWLALILAGRPACGGTAKAKFPRPPGISIVVIRSTANTTMSQARTS